MSTSNRGTQVFTFDLHEEGTAAGFNRVLRDLLPPGIYSGCALTLTSGKARIGTGTLLLALGNGTSVRCEIASVYDHISVAVPLTGSIDPTASTAVIGVGTAFLTELALGNRILVSGETRTVVAIADNTHLTVDTAFSNNANDTSPDKLSDLESYNGDVAVANGTYWFYVTYTWSTTADANYLDFHLLSSGSPAPSGQVVFGQITVASGVVTAVSDTGRILGLTREWLSAEGIALTGDARYMRKDIDAPDPETVQGSKIFQAEVRVVGPIHAVLDPTDSPADDLSVGGRLYNDTRYLRLANATQQVITSEIRLSGAANLRAALTLGSGGSIDAAGFAITGLPSPSNGTDAVNKTYADALVAGGLVHTTGDELLADTKTFSTAPLTTADPVSANGLGRRSYNDLRYAAIGAVLTKWQGARLTLTTDAITGTPAKLAASATAFDTDTIVTATAPIKLTVHTTSLVELALDLDLSITSAIYGRVDAVLIDVLVNGGSVFTEILRASIPFASPAPWLERCQVLVPLNLNATDYVEVKASISDTVNVTACSVAASSYLALRYASGGTGASTLSADLDAATFQIINLGTPVADSNAATKVYVDDIIATFPSPGNIALLNGYQTFTGTNIFSGITTFNSALVGTLDPTADTHVGNRLYNDGRYMRLSGGAFTGEITTTIDPTGNNGIARRSYNDARYLRLSAGAPQTVVDAVTFTAAPSSAADPSTGNHLVRASAGDTRWQLRSEKGSANGYASLSGLARVPLAQLGSGTPDGTKYLDGTGAWTVPSATGAVLLTGDQNVAGIKTYTSGLAISVDGEPPSNPTGGDLLRVGNIEYNDARYLRLGGSAQSITKATTFTSSLIKTGSAGAGTDVLNRADGDNRYWQLTDSEVLTVSGAQSVAGIKTFNATNGLRVTTPPDDVVGDAVPNLDYLVASYPKLTGGLVPTAKLGSGSALATTFLAGDRAYKTVPGTVVDATIAATGQVTYDSTLSGLVQAWQRVTFSPGSDLAQNDTTLVDVALPFPFSACYSALATSDAGAGVFLGYTINGVERDLGSNRVRIHVTITAGGGMTTLDTLAIFTEVRGLKA